MIQQARRRCKNTEFVVGTGETLPFDDCSFNVITSLLAFSYIKHPQAMLDEAYRVLKPGGANRHLYLWKETPYLQHPHHLPNRRNYESKSCCY